MNTCSVEACSKPIKRSKYCYGHYMKNWRYGTPEPFWPDRWVDEIGNRYGTLVVCVREGSKWLCKCDCGETRLASAGELHRTGERNTCGTPGKHLSDDVGYNGAHARIVSMHGTAKNHNCFDCGEPALHWSYNHSDPDEKVAVGLSANPVAYSTDPAHYSARCVPCHKAYDLGRRAATFG